MGDRRFVPLCMVLAACILQGASCFYDAEDSKVVTLDEKTFESEVIQSDDAVWLMEFYAPWCGHCKSLAPTYEKVAKNLDGLVKVGAVDCDKYQSIGEKAGVRGFPSLKVYTPEVTYNPYTKKSAKVPVDVKGARTAKALVESVLEMVPNYVLNVSAASSDKFLSDKAYPKAILFSDKAAPPSLIKSLAVQFRGRIRFGMAGSADKDFATKFGVTEFPRLVVVPGDDASAAVVHEGKLKSAEVSEFLAGHALKEKKADGLQGEDEKGVEVVKALATEEEWAEVMADKKHFYTIFFHKGGEVPASVGKMTSSFKSFKHASVDCTKLAAACKDNVIDTTPALRLYMADKSEYEEFTGGADCLEDCMETEALSDFVAESIPNIVIPVDQGSFNNFLVPSSERPRVLLFTKKAEPTPLFKSVALHYKDILTFGLIANPPKAILDNVGLKKLPMLLIFFSQNGTAETVQGYPYQGDFSYDSMVNTIDQFAAPFREGAKSGSEPGKAASQAPTGPIPEMGKGDGSTYEKLCGDRGGLCAVAFLDGSEGSKEKREEQLKVLEGVRTKMHPSPFHISWVDAVCHPDFAMSFDVSQDRVPTLAVISPSKGRYLQHIGKFAAAELQSTLQGVVSGKKQTGPFSLVNPMSERDCAEVHAEILAATTGGGASEEDDEIMREMMEEIKRKEKEADDADEEDGGKKKKKKGKKKKAKK